MASPQIVVYATPWCPYCHAARSLLGKKGVEFEEIDLMKDPGRRSEMVERSGRTSVPQIFIDEFHVGGFDDLAALEREGRLDALLAGDTGNQQDCGDDNGE